ncbi:MAG TPA: glycosyl hydrolase [Sedimentisphaerales bacterium]|nr:glycosyl hydrolase [Sedimentisphaerales bacterium]
MRWFGGGTDCARLAKLIVLSLVVLAACMSGLAQAADSASVKALFANPPRQYSTAPLWVWNDMLTEEQIVSTLRDLAGQNVRQVFVHPRPGLMTPYLSQDWFRLWKVALKEAERLDMNVWIYDENSYPSGFAGGLVPEAMPESRSKGLQIEEANRTPEWNDDIIGVYRLTDNRYQNVTQAVRAGQSLPQDDYLVASIKLAPTSPWYGGKFYTNLIKPGVTEKFLEITMDAYKREVGEQFGKRIPGVFTDEPRLSRASTIAWTDDLDEAFEKRWGYRLTDHLPSLFRPVGDWKRVRHNYRAVLLELLIERWARPYYEYCERHNLEFTGHYWEHSWPKTKDVPDNMAVYAWQQRPGIDTLFNQYSEGTHAQFGNIRAVIELASVANQLGKRRTLCEAFGGSGWDLRFEDMKRIGDWLYVLGVNTINEHLSDITIRGARKADYPQSFSYHEPWWQAYHVMARYFTRLSAALSAGEQINNILLIEPTPTAWMYQGDSEHSDHLERLGTEFQKLVTELAKAQVEYDIGCEDIIANHGSVEGALFKVGNRRYEIIILPPFTENLNGGTAKLIEAYAKAGGKILCCGEPPALVDGSPSNVGKSASRNRSWKQVEPNDVAVMLLRRSTDGFGIQRNRGLGGLLFHHRRRLDDGEILFLVNTSIDSPITGRLQSPMRSIQRWDLETGNISSYAFTAQRDGVRADFELAPCGSLLLFLSNKRGEAAPPEPAQTAKVEPAGPLRIRRTEQNVLTLDYVDVTAGGETKKNIYFYEASKLVFQKHGMEGNPWDSAVQFRDELISTKFPADSGFEATYRFTIEGPVPRPLYIVIERPDLYQITCNGKKVVAREGSWWLDRSFGKIDISSAAKTGENAVTIKAAPFTVFHELSAAYLLGDFSVRATDAGFVVGPDAPLEVGPWSEQGHPLYAAGVSYTQDFEIGKPKGKYSVRLPSWYGSVARVTVNNKEAGYIHHQPWELEVTDLIRSGANRIDVTVIGTLKNTLGPHHGNPKPGRSGPASFRKGPDTGPPPGAQYQSIGYGLFKPFELHNNRHQM